MGKAGRLRRAKKEQDRRKRRSAQSAQAPRRPAPGHVPPDAELAARVAAEAVRALCAGDQGGFDRCLARLADSRRREWTQAVSGCLTGALRHSVTAAWHNGWQPAELARHIGRELSGTHALMLADMITDEMRQYAAAAVPGRWAAQVAALATAGPGDGSAGPGDDSAGPVAGGAGPGSGPWWGSGRDYLVAWQARAGGRTALGGLLGTVATALEVLHQLQHLPALERLLPLPGTAAAASAPRRSSAAAAAADERVLSRIRALLAKAESTEFAEEAEALSARAQELMAKYSIDHALLASGQEDADRPAARRIPVDGPYESPKVQLLSEVARANRCRTVWARDLGLVTVIGFEPDLDAVELLFTSLLVQANTAMMRAGARRDARGQSRTRAFRQSFLVSYACRIGERLAEAASQAVRDAAGEQAASGRQRPGGGPGTDLVPLLAARQREVDDAVEEMFGDGLIATRAARATDAEGWHSGRAAADMATLRNRGQVTE
jgi:hypothetical protein